MPGVDTTRNNSAAGYFNLKEQERGSPGGPPGLALRAPCVTWEREARYWLAGMGGKWLLLVLLLLKPPRLDMLATDAPPGVAGGVAARASPLFTLSHYPGNICYGLH